MINGPEKLFSSRERLEGFRQALSISRLKYDPSLVVNSDLSRESLIRAVQELLASKRKPTALVAFHDNAAIEIIEYLKSIKKDKTIPVVSFANLPMSSHSVFKPAASVEQYPYLQGQKAMEVLIDVLNNKSSNESANSAFYKIILDSRLVILK